MSDSYLRIIPVDPERVVSDEAAASGEALMRRLCPRARGVHSIRYDEISFVDPGGDVGDIHCPICGAEVDTDWWGDAVSTAAEGAFADLRATTPCCDSEVSLNDLKYESGGGFSRFVIEAVEPDRAELTESEREEMAAALGGAVREIWAHY